jgi:hypothetical protein
MMPITGVIFKKLIPSPGRQPVFGERGPVPGMKMTPQDFRRVPGVARTCGKSAVGMQVGRQHALQQCISTSGRKS